MAEKLKSTDKVKLKAKAKKVHDDVKARHGNGQFSVTTPGGEVQFQSVTQVTDEDGVDFVEVRLAGQTESGEAHYRIVNPPLLVRNPDGSTTEDSVQALANILSRAGGSRK